MYYCKKCGSTILGFHYESCPDRNGRKFFEADGFHVLFSGYGESGHDALYVRFFSYRRARVICDTSLPREAMRSLENDLARAGRVQKDNHVVYLICGKTNWGKMYFIGALMFSDSNVYMTNNHKHFLESCPGG